MKTVNLSTTLLAAYLAVPAVAEAEIPLGSWDATPSAPLTTNVM